MTDKERTEIHKTEFVDKQLPTIYYEQVEQTDMSKAKSTIIKVSDNDINKALETFNKVKEKV